MRKMLVRVFSCALILGAMVAESAVNNYGANIVVSSGTSFVVTGSGSEGAFVNSSDGSFHGTVRLYGTMYVKGNFANNATLGPTFSNDSTGLVNLNGTGQSISGPNSFPNLTKNVISADTLTFAPGASAMTEILGTLTLQGAAGQLLSLRSSTPGAQWQIDPQGARTLAYLDIQDCSNINATPINAPNNCVDSGNNSGWNFGGTTYTVTFIAGANGSISGTSPQTVVSGGNCSDVTAVPDTGFSFVDWTGDYTGTANPLTITNVVANMNITANFAAIPPGSHTVTFVAGAGGSITGTTTQIVPDGNNCTAVTPVPDTGYAFVNWTGDYTGTDNPLTVTNVTADMTITANFSASSYTVTFTAGANGSISGTSPQTVPYGGNCTDVSATPDTGYYFSGWTGSYTGTNNPLTVTNVTSDMNITANFTSVPPGSYVVNFTAGANGTLSGNVSQIVASGGDCTQVTAVPDSGYQFHNWTGDFSGAVNPLTITNVIANMNITANFIVNPVGSFTVTFVAGSYGTVTGDVSQVVASGSDCTPVTAVPEPGYGFTGWTGSLSSTDNPLTVTNVVANMVIVANFGLSDNAVTPGKIYRLFPSDIAGYTIANFASKPASTGSYTSAGKTYKAGMKVANKITKAVPTPFADLEWTKNAVLVSKKEWLKTETCAQTIARLFPVTGQIASQNYALTTNITFTDAGGIKQKLKNAASGNLDLMPPFISEVTDDAGIPIVSAGLNVEIVIVGVFFGKSSPGVWLEYLDGTTVKKLKLKVVKPYNYADYKGTAGKSCMNIYTGESSINVMMPSKWPKNWTHGVHNIVIENKIARATIVFSTVP